MQIIFSSKHDVMAESDHLHMENGYCFIGYSISDKPDTAGGQWLEKRGRGEGLEVRERVCPGEFRT